MILDYLFTIGQAASTLLLLYGGYLTVMPLQREPRKLAPSRENALLVLRHDA